MAKILTTAIVADIRNKLNGSVFSKNKAGAYIRTKVTPVNPQSVAQQNVRNILASNSQAWRGLTEPQRQGWNNAAPNFPYTDIFGNIKQLSGFQLFVKLNTNLATVEATLITDAPTPVAIPAIAALAVAADDSANTVILTFSPGTIPAGFSMLVEATPNVTPGKEFVKNLYRVTTILEAAATSPADISTPYHNIFGDPVTGMKVFARVKFVSTTTGQAGIPIAASTTVVA